MAEVTKGIGNFNNDKIYCFTFDSLFGYKILVDAAEDFVADFIGTTKTSIK